MGLVLEEHQPRTDTSRSCVRGGHGTKQLPEGLIQLLGMGAAAETQDSTSPFLLPAGGDAEVGSVQQGHLQS